MSAVGISGLQAGEDVKRVLRSKVACQHINVNPHDLSGDSVEAKLLVEQVDAGGNTYLIPEAGSPYYDYSISQFDHGACRDALKRKAEIVIKELALKQLLLYRKARISTSLPNQRHLLTKDLVVITDGYLFTVNDDRPVLLPFNPSVPAHVVECDGVLAPFGVSVTSLLDLLQREWPYSYRPQAVLQRFGSEAEKLTRFARRLTIVIHKADSVSVIFQDPGYETPHMLPQGLQDVAAFLEKQGRKLPLSRWLLPPTLTLEQKVAQLIEEENPSLESDGKRGKKRAFPAQGKVLETLVGFWNLSLRELAGDGHGEADYETLRKRTFRHYLNHLNADLAPGQPPKKRVSTALIAAWTRLLSSIFELPLQDMRGWLENVPGIKRLWHDPEQGFFIVGGLAPLKSKISRQPSIRQWHALQGELNPELLVDLVDVDWVRANQLAGNPCVKTLVKRWRECQGKPDEALYP